MERSPASSIEAYSPARSLTPCVPAYRQRGSGQGLLVRFCVKQWLGQFEKHWMALEDVLGGLGRHRKRHRGRRRECTQNIPTKHIATYTQSLMASPHRREREKHHQCCFFWGLPAPRMHRVMCYPTQTQCCSFSTIHHPGPPKSRGGGLICAEKAANWDQPTSAHASTPHPPPLPTGALVKYRPSTAGGDFRH